MLTIATSCAPFVGKTKQIQRNAFHSWLNLTPTPEILIMGGREEGVKEFADEYGIRVVDVEYSDYGMPLFNSMFQNAQNEAKNDVLCYSNCDILHFQCLVEAVKLLKASDFKKWVATGRRLNVDIGNFELPRFVDIETNIKLDDLIRNGRLHSFSACDYYIFPRDFDWSHMPPFVYTRPGSDTWINYDTLERGIPLINLDHDVTVIHQGIDRPYADQVRLDLLPQRVHDIDTKRVGDGWEVRRGAKDMDTFNKQCAENGALAGTKCVGCDVASYFLRDWVIVSKGGISIL